MTDTEFLTYYTLTATLAVLLLAVWRIRNNWSVLTSVPCEAEIVAVEKDVDVIISINIEIKTRNSLGIQQVHINPMYDQTEYKVGAPFAVWLSKNNPNLYFTSKPNALQLILKIGFHSFIIWFLLCGMLLLFFAKI